ncbi:outer membrane beta-barrel protein [Spirosoma sp. SC4-14]|uniref:outer membrane beta-barrel protein n=1 Tax=Spirosoma sp. SC4-14 TaxID=3128900 RepID=UPI0030CF531C
MQPFKRILTSFFLLYGLSHYAYSQLFFTDGYIVLASGDTIAGQVRERSNQLIEFRPGQSASAQPYSPQQLISYYSDGTNRVSVRITEEGKVSTYFMREQVDGYIGLYSLQKAENHLTHAIRLPDKTFVPLRGNLSLLMLARHLTECSDPKFKQLLNPQTFYIATSKLERIIKAYNECVRPAQSVPRQRKVFRYEAGISVSAVENSWVYGHTDKLNTVYYNPFGKFSSMYAVALGGFFTVAPQKRLSPGIELLASWYKGSRSVPLTNPLDPTAQGNRLYTFNETYIALPITARYICINKAIRWYLKAGIVPTLSTSVHGKYSDTNLNLHNDDIPILNKTNIGIGYIAGIGLDFTLKKKRHFYFELRTMPHLVLDGVTRTATSRSFQATLHIPLAKHK